MKPPEIEFDEVVLRFGKKDYRISMNGQVHYPLSKCVCEYIDALEKQIPIWHDAKTDPPLRSGAYLVCVDGEVWAANPIASYILTPDKQKWVGGYDNNITHWMPLPEPPKDENPPKQDGSWIYPSAMESEG